MEGSVLPSHLIFTVEKGRPGQGVTQVCLSVPCPAAAVPALPRELRLLQALKGQRTLPPPQEAFQGKEGGRSRWKTSSNYLHFKRHFPEVEDSLKFFTNCSSAPASKESSLQLLFKTATFPAFRLFWNGVLDVRHYQRERGREGFSLVSLCTARKRKKLIFK